MAYVSIIICPLLYRFVLHVVPELQGEPIDIVRDKCALAVDKVIVVVVITVLKYKVAIKPAASQYSAVYSQ